jgi:cell division inhibitor SepF
MVDGGARMGALRRAGVWLGLVEEDDERGYDHRGYRGYGVGYGDDFVDDEDDVDDVPVTPRARMGTDRLTDRQSERSERISERLATERSDRLANERSDRLANERSDRLASDRGERLATERSERLSTTTLGSPSDRLSDRLSERLAERSDTRSTVRSITRPTSTVSYPTRDNLALAPQVQVRDRVVTEEDSEAQRHAITTLHPTTYNEARTIGEHFRDGVPVIMNLTEMDEADAKRLVDFAAGLVFGLRGNFERVTNRVFLLSPANVQVTAEDKAKIAEGGFFNQS